MVLTKRNLRVVQVNFGYGKDGAVNDINAHLLVDIVENEALLSTLAQTVDITDLLTKAERGVLDKLVQKIRDANQ